jgi:hypothetical protein
MGSFEILKLGKPDLKLSSGVLTCHPLKFETMQDIHMMIRQWVKRLPPPDTMQCTQLAKGWSLSALFRGTFIMPSKALNLNRSPKLSKKASSSGWWPPFFTSVIAIVAVLAFLDGVGLVLVLVLVLVLTVLG